MHMPTRLVHSIARFLAIVSDPFYVEKNSGARVKMVGHMTL